MILPASYYSSEDPVYIARDLLGKVIVTDIDGLHTSGIIVETEAYIAPEDQASHAKNNRRTPRTSTFFEIGGTAYVYVCYGVHHLFNVITGPIDVPHAILIRGLEPLNGIDQVSAGPGILSQALGISKVHNGLLLNDPHSAIRIEDHYIPVDDNNIVAGPRIGIHSAGPRWIQAPFRFYIKNNKWVSK
ncbi:UNVERIFIED_CONTAM: hypothetical protein GTU68_041800 [Idotea baltica]|nr:hypothetical protein [Idotea baltica]